METLGRDQIEVRRYGIEDESFIISSWLKSYKHSSSFAKRIRENIYYQFHHYIVEQILRRDSTSVHIACPKGELEVILGYLVTEEGADPIIHYAYVKQAFRGMGIGQMLFKTSGFNPDRTIFTHWCFDTDWITEKLPGLKYNPYLI